MTSFDEQARLWRARDLLKQAQLALPVSGVGTYDPANKAISRAMRRVDKQIARLTVAWVQHMSAPATLPVPKRTVGPRFDDHAELLGSFVTRERPIIGEPGIVHSTPAPDTRALEQIATELDGQEWSPDTLANIADIVRGSGRQVRDIEDMPEEDA